jgi:hypothetical protein
MKEKTIENRGLKSEDRNDNWISRFNSEEFTVSMSKEEDNSILNNKETEENFLTVQRKRDSNQKI